MGWILIPNNTFVIPPSRHDVVGLHALPRLCKWQITSSGEVAAIRSCNFPYCCEVSKLIEILEIV